MTFTYVEMVCQLNEEHFDERMPIADVRLEDIQNVGLDVLFDGYTQSFERGDAVFYQQQSPIERRRYFDEELGFPEVLHNPASIAYFLDDELIGFALVMPYLEANYHISCMCVLPAFQGRGMGRAMLNRIKNVARHNGCRSLSLGTELTMRAFHQYQNFGFEITAEHQVDL